MSVGSGVFEYFANDVVSPDTPTITGTPYETTWLPMVPPGETASREFLKDVDMVQRAVVDREHFNGEKECIEKDNTQITAERIRSESGVELLVKTIVNPNLVTEDDLAGIKKLDLCDSHTRNVLPRLLQCLPNIEVLNASSNALEDEDMATISSSLSKCTRLKQIELQGNKIKTSGGEALAKALLSMPLLEALYMNYNKVRDEAGTALINSVSTATKTINMLQTDVGDATARSLITRIPELTNLEQVDLRYNDKITKELKEELRTAWKTANKAKKGLVL